MITKTIVNSEMGHNENRPGKRLGYVMAII